MIYVIVPVFNRKAFTEHFLYCMSKQTFRNFETIVVDDGSTDGTARLIRERFPAVRLLRGDGHLWWTGAINLGIKYALAAAAQDDSILVINDDLEIDSNYLQALYELSLSMPHALIGSVLVNIENPKLIVDGGRTINWWTAKFSILNSQRQLSEFPSEHAVDVSLLTGSGTLIPAEVFRKVGLYDDKHFQQCGDTELPVRAKNAGYRLVVSYKAVIKAHVRATDTVNVVTRYSVRDLKRYFFDVRSNSRLKYRFFFCLNTARTSFGFLAFLVFDLVRVTGHFVRRLRLNIRDGGTGKSVRHPTA
jgi:GT2 family glycosyltransferase